MPRKTIAATVVALALVLVPAVAHAENATVDVVLDQPGGGAPTSQQSVFDGGDDSSLAPYLGVGLGLCMFGLTLGFLLRRRFAVDHDDELVTGLLRRRTRGEFWELTGPAREVVPPPASANGRNDHRQPAQQALDRGLVSTP